MYIGEVSGVAGSEDLNKVPFGRLGLLTAFKPNADESECSLARCLYLASIGSVMLILNRPDDELRRRWPNALDVGRLAQNFAVLSPVNDIAVDCVRFGVC